MWVPARRVRLDVGYARCRGEQNLYTTRQDATACSTGPRLKRNGQKEGPLQTLTPRAGESFIFSNLFFYNFVVC